MMQGQQQRIKFSFVEARYVEYFYIYYIEIGKVCPKLFQWHTHINIGFIKYLKVVSKAVLHRF